jgi:hypothetical protein
MKSISRKGAKKRKTKGAKKQHLNGFLSAFRFSVLCAFA